MRGLVEQFHCTHLNPPTHIPWREQWLPNTACWQVATRHHLLGPRLSHSTACASGLIAVLTAVRSIQDGQCDVALAGSAEAITPLFAAGFHQMRVLANHDDPRQACRPFDLDRQGFVMGEGGAMFVLERRSHAVARGAQIYAEVAGGRLLAMAHHVTGLDVESDALVHLISETLRVSDLEPKDIGYINVHGTATQQNDVTEARAIRRAMGRATDSLCASATKSILGHLINAAGSVELAVTALAMRDGFVPPTLNLTRPDPECDLDCIPLVGRKTQVISALKLSVAFGGTLAAVALTRPDVAMSARRPTRLAA
jgi:3-oxoacyl-(acyl-carrier-protein) synthase